MFSFYNRNFLRNVIVILDEQCAVWGTVDFLGTKCILISKFVEYLFQLAVIIHDCLKFTDHHGSFAKHGLSLEQAMARRSMGHGLNHGWRSMRCQPGHVQLMNLIKFNACIEFFKFHSLDHYFIHNSKTYVESSSRILTILKPTISQKFVQLLLK